MLRPRSSLIVKCCENASLVAGPIGTLPERISPYVKLAGSTSASTNRPQVGGSLLQQSYLNGCPPGTYAPGQHPDWRPITLHWIQKSSAWFPVRTQLLAHLHLTGHQKRCTLRTQFECSFHSNFGILTLEKSDRNKPVICIGSKRTEQLGAMNCIDNQSALHRWMHPFKTDQGFSVGIENSLHQNGVISTLRPRKKPSKKVTPPSSSQLPRGVQVV
eukprot:g71115.t1